MSDKPHWPMTELWVDKRATEYKPYKLDDELPHNAIPQYMSAAEAGRMEISGEVTVFFTDEKLLYQLLDKRRLKHTVNRIWNNCRYPRKSKGWRKHLRKNKP